MTDILEGLEGMTCPICGGTLSRKYNYSSESYYYGCNQIGCYFRLSEDSNPADYYLQGRVLEGKCKGCGSPLVVTLGPYGLYARCFKCNYDLDPAHKFENARSSKNRAEINYLIGEFKKASENSKNLQKEYHEYINKDDNFYIETHAQASRDKYNYIVEALLNRLKEENKKEVKLSKTELGKILEKSLKGIISRAERRALLREDHYGETKDILKGILQSKGYDLVNATGGTTFNGVLLKKYEPLSEAPIEDSIKNDKDLQKEYHEPLEDEGGFFADIESTRECSEYKNKERPLSPSDIPSLNVTYLNDIDLEEEWNSEEFSTLYKAGINLDNLSTSIGRREELMKYMKEHLEEPVSSVSITNLANKKVGAYKYCTDQWAPIFRQLNNEGKIKLVGKDQGSPQYQLIESPIPELHLVTESEGYTFISEFCKEFLTNERVNKYGVSQHKFKRFVEEHNFETYWAKQKRNNSLQVAYLKEDLIKASEEYLEEEIRSTYFILQYYKECGTLDLIMNWFKAQQSFSNTDFKNYLKTFRSFEDDHSLEIEASSIIHALLVEGTLRIYRISVWEFFQSCNKIRYSKLLYTIREPLGLQVDWEETSVNVTDYITLKTLNKKENFIAALISSPKLSTKCFIRKDPTCLGYYNLSYNKEALLEAWEDYNNPKPTLTVAEKEQKIVKYLKEHVDEEFTSSALSREMSTLNNNSRDQWLTAIGNLKKKGYIKPVAIKECKIIYQYINGPLEPIKYYEGIDYSSITAFKKEIDLTSPKVPTAKLVTLTDTIKKELANDFVYKEPFYTCYSVEKMKRIYNRLAKQFLEKTQRIENTCPSIIYLPDTKAKKPEPIDPPSTVYLPDTKAKKPTRTFWSNVLGLLHGQKKKPVRYSEENIQF